jgi:hypothetical protein
MRPRSKRHAAAAQFDFGIRAREFSIMVWPTSRFMILFKRHDLLVENGVDIDRVDHNSVARWLSQIESRPNFSPMNCCSSKLADGFERRIGQESSVRPPRSSMSMRNFTRMAALAGRAIAAKARIGFQAVERKRHRRQRLESLHMSWRITSVMRCTSVRSMVV